jgi:hypothetical protein
MSTAANNEQSLTPREQRAKDRNLPAITACSRYYDASKNPNESRYITGVPLRDLSEDEFKALPEHLQRAVDGSDLYRKTKPPVANTASPKPKQED